MRNRVSLFLMVTLFVVGVLPLVASYFLVEDVLKTQERIYLNADLNKSLLDYEMTLKKVSKLDPEQENIYKNKFQEVQKLKLLFGEDTYLSEAVRASILKYFFVIFGIGVVVSLLMGLALSFKVNSIYLKSFDDLLREKEKSRFLNEVAKWKEVAQKIAHEIRRPLQPMRIWATQLQKQESMDRQQLNEVSSAMQEEIRFLSSMVSEFSEFADIPKPKFEKTDLGDFLVAFVKQYQNVWDEVQFANPLLEKASPVSIDPKIFRTLLTNLIENAVEANPEQKVVVTFSSKLQAEAILLNIHNSGVSLSDTDRERIFDIYYSTKVNCKNKGLGLAIVKSIALEHDGNIQCVPAVGGVQFEIRLPLRKG